MADQTTGVVSGPGPKSLAAFTLDIIADAQRNRLPVERKWLSNIRDAVPERLRPSPAGLNEQWQQAEGVETWQSRSRIGVTAQKIQAACDFADDILYKHGDVPFMASIEDAQASAAPAYMPSASVGQVLSMPRPEGGEPEQPGRLRKAVAAVAARMGLAPSPDQDREAIEERVEKFMDERQRQCDGVRQKRKLFRDRATYGESYTHVIGFQDASVPSGVRFGGETVSPWECYRDEENDGPLDRGEYFFRVQRRAPWRIWLDAIEAPAWIDGASGQRVGVYFNLDTLRAALASSPPMPGTGTSATSATPTIHQGGKPEHTDLVNRQRTVEITEVWGWVPVSVVRQFEEDTPGCIRSYTLPEMLLRYPPADTSEGSAIQFYSEDRVWCLRYCVNGVMVGYIPEPGPLPYNREVWAEQSGVRFGVGVADMNHDHQHTLDGLCKALDDSLKFVSKLVFAVIEGRMVNEPKDIFQGGVGMIRLNPEYAKNISDAFQALRLPDPTPTIIEGIRTVMELSDQESHIARIQQGQMPISPNTAFELQQRLEGSGRHMGSQIRTHDRQTEWEMQYMLECERAAGNIDLPIPVNIRAGGFKEFSKRITEFQGLMGMIQLALSAPQIEKRLQYGWALHELAGSQSVDPEKLWKSEEEVQVEEQARMGDPMQALQLQLVEAELALAQAKVGTEDAKAKDLLAAAQLKLSQVGAQQQEAQRKRAETAHKITEDLRNRTERAQAAWKPAIRQDRDRERKAVARNEGPAA
jgi:hypothetical protein